jgi:hypothetical protein
VSVLSTIISRVPGRRSRLIEDIRKPGVEIDALGDRHTMSPNGLYRK